MPCRMYSPGLMEIRGKWGCGFRIVQLSGLVSFQLIQFYYISLSLRLKSALLLLWLCYKTWFLSFRAQLFKYAWKAKATNQPTNTTFTTHEFSSFNFEHDFNFADFTLFLEREEKQASKVQYVTRGRRVKSIMANSNRKLFRDGKYFLEKNIKNFARFF